MRALSRSNRPSSSRDTVFSEIRPGAGFETGEDLIKEKLGGEGGGGGGCASLLVSVFALAVVFGSEVLFQRDSSAASLLPQGPTKLEGSMVGVRAMTKASPRHGAAPTSVPSTAVARRMVLVFAGFRLPRFPIARQQYLRDARDRGLYFPRELSVGLAPLTGFCWPYVAWRGSVGCEMSASRRSLGGRFHEAR